MSGAIAFPLSYGEYPKHEIVNRENGKNFDFRIISHSADFFTDCIRTIYLVTANSGPITVTLSTACLACQEAFVIKHIAGPNDIIVTTEGGELIDLETGPFTLDSSLHPKSSVTFVSSGANWFITGTTVRNYDASQPGNVDIWS